MKILLVDDEDDDEDVVLRLDEDMKKAFLGKDIAGYLNARLPKGGRSHRAKKSKVFIRTFGNFELFYNNEIVAFNHSKAKELLAYLVDRRGSGVTTPEAYCVLWEDDEYTESTKDKIQHTKKDLRDTLDRYGLSDILIKGRNLLALDTNKVDCDYYEYLDGDPEAQRYFAGEYMTQYSWAENTLGELESLRENSLSKKVGQYPLRVLTPKSGSIPPEGTDPKFRE